MASNDSVGVRRDGDADVRVDRRTNGARST
jgi:hypothetical protein